FECDIKEYELNKGRCKNGGFPDPLKSCKCRCPDGYGGDYCTKYEYGFCRVTELKAKVEAQYINSKEFSILRRAIFCLYVIKPKETNPNQIKAKRTLIEVRKIKGWARDYCGHPCRDNYIEIKYLKDKTPTGARICCDTKNDRILTISSDENTEVLIMIKNWIGQYDISYKAELAPAQESSNCIEARNSILKRDNLPYPQENYLLDENGKLARTPEGNLISPDLFGPSFSLVCNRHKSMIINGEYFRRNDCVEDNDPNPDCTYSSNFDCMVINI
uniref:EGF-like domain-containing protein n=1 Tax=Meloidogyne javanica TaxID=6303 RepID=A0A915LHC0_MELJA